MQFDLMGNIVKEAAEYTKDQDSLGCAKLVVFCNAPDDNPFMAGAFHGVTEADAIINVGVSGPGVVNARNFTGAWSRILRCFVRLSRRLHLRLPE